MAQHTTTRPGHRHSLAVAAFVVGATLAVAIAAVITSDDDSGEGRTTLASSGAAEVELDRFDGGTPLVLADVGDGPLVVNFFASWCGPCAREMPDFEDVHRQRGDEVRFIGVNIQDTPAAALDLVERTGVTYEVVRDTEGALFRAVGAVSMPTTVFVSADGEITEVRGGELSVGALHERVDRLLGT